MLAEQAVASLAEDVFIEDPKLSRFDLRERYFEVVLLVAAQVHPRESTRNDVRLDESGDLAGRPATMVFHQLDNLCSR